MNLGSGDDEGRSVRDPLKLVCNRISKWKDELITAPTHPRRGAPDRTGQCRPGSRSIPQACAQRPGSTLSISAFYATPTLPISEICCFGQCGP